MDLTGIGSVANFAKSIVERIFPPKMTDAEKAQGQIQLQDMLERRENTVVEAQRAIIVSEMQQGDNFTKRARPTLVYAGLVFIFLVHVALPMFAFFTSKPIPELSLPADFWWAWSGVCGIWVIGRSAERRGMTGKIVSMITGNK